MEAAQKYAKAKKLHKEGRISEAISAFQDCLKRDHKNVIYLFELGELYAEAGERDKAKKCFLEIEAVEPYSMYAKAAAERLDKIDDDRTT